jgi:hypothetical protein
VTQVISSFEGGTPGVSVTTGNSGGASGSAFDVVQAGAGAVNAYDAAQAAHGSVSCKISTGGTAASAYNSWTTSAGSLAQAWFRAYFFMTANPAVQHRLVNFLAGASQVGNVLLKANGALIFTNSAGGTVLTSAAVIPLNAWWRLEGFVTGSAAAGQWEFRLFTSAPDGVTPDETQTSAASQPMTGPPDTYRFGVGANIANAGPFWMDDIGVSPAGYLGPALVRPVPVMLTAASAPAGSLTAAAAPSGTLTAGTQSAGGPQ